MEIWIATSSLTVIVERAVGAAAAVASVMASLLGPAQWLSVFSFFSRYMEYRDMQKQKAKKKRATKT